MHSNNRKKMPDSSDPPSFIVKFANFILFLGVLFPVFILPYSFQKFSTVRVAELGFTVKYIIIWMVVLGLFVLLLRLKNLIKVNIALVVVSIISSVYAAEIFLTFFEIPSQNKKKSIIISIGNNFDKREKIEVINDLRSVGIDAYPNFLPIGYLDVLSKQNSQFLPLGGISNKTIVCCNENGYWSVYESDQYGFNNPENLYNQTQIDLVLIGDSFIEGSCVKPSENIAEGLRQFGYRVMNLGRAGHSPLLELATLVEYALHFKPKIVLWFYNEGDDLTGLEKEQKFDFLKRYLYKDNFSQNLIVRQEEVDRLLIDYIEQKKMEEETENKEIGKNKNMISKLSFNSMLKLDRIREKLNLRYSNPSIPPPVTFKPILKKADQLVSDWGGKIYFIYLPGLQRYRVAESRLWRDPKARDFVLKIASDLGIPVIDIHNEVFAALPEPLILFPEKLLGHHYSAMGHREVAEAIAKRLQKDTLN